MYYNKKNASSQSNNNLNDINFVDSKKLQQNSQIQEVFDQWDEHDIEQDFREKSKCLLSLGLPVNNIAEEMSNKMANLSNDAIFDLYKEYTGSYTRFLSEHGCRDIAIARHNGLNDEVSPDIGWKFHLNIKPEHVIIVDNYLKNTGFVYKFLSGGDIDQGKIFTIYIGSYSLMKKIATVIHSNIGKYLCKPQTSCNDIEFAPGVVGRFSYKGGNKEGFNREDKYGFPMKRLLKPLGDKKMELISYRLLKEKFGKYFHI